MSLDDWVRENGAAAIEAAQARAGESEVERLREEVRRCEIDLRDLMAYVDDAKLAMRDHRVSGQPLGEAIRDLVEKCERTDDALDARLFDVRTAVELEREACAKLVESATGPESTWYEGVVMISSGDIARLIRARGGK